MLLSTGAPARRRRTGGRRGPGGWRGAVRALFGALIVVALVAGAAYGFYVWQKGNSATEDRKAKAQQFVDAWERGDRAEMWRALTPASREITDEESFNTAYERAYRAAGVREVSVGDLGEERDGVIPVPVTVTTESFGTLRGTVELPVKGSDGNAGIVWASRLRLPGLRDEEAVRRRSGPPPERGEILAADGTVLDATALGASIAGRPGSGEEKPTGLQRIFNDRLAGRPAARLYFGKRVVARTKAQPGRDVRTTIRPDLMERASAALGGNLGGVAVIRPRDGAVLALAGLAVSAPQPPGSVFKIITAAAALEDGKAKPSTRYPVQTAATLSGTRLRNAGGESCGGTLTESFIHSCNSVFAPLGAELGAKRLVEAAEEFGFNSKPRLPAAKPSTLAPADKMRDDLAVGAAAIGQDRDLATPLIMASVAGTIAAGGVRAEPRISGLQRVIRRRVVSKRVARQVRTMMVGVVESGTGTAAAVPGVQVAGKTGTAELRANSSAPEDSNAWFVAFAPAERPRVAVAVMLVGAGFGGDSAAPVAAEVIRAALASD